MKTWKHQPEDKRLAMYIDCYWLLIKEEGDESCAFPKLIANPSANLILTPEHQHHQYRQNDEPFEIKGSHLILAATGCSSLDHSEPFSIIGVKFHPGAIYSLFPQLEQAPDSIIPVSERLFSSLKIPTNWPDNDDQEAVSKMLDSLMMPLVINAREDRHTLLTRDIISRLSTTPLSRLKQELPHSSRTLERSFVRVTGLTLKQYEAIVRLHQLIEFLYKHPSDNPDWADIAIRFGFCDQPHLIRQLKKNIGLTPLGYLNLRNLAIDAYGDFK